MITGRHVRELANARWRNTVLGLRVEIQKMEADRLMQYAALIALAHAEGQDLAPILDQARGRLTTWGYDALVKFADRAR